MSIRETPGMVELEEHSSAIGTLLLLRGVVAVVFGLIALSNPGATAAALVILFAIWAFVDAGLEVGAAVRRGQEHRPWGWFAFEAFVSAAAGVAALVYPAITLLVLVVIVALRAIILGILMMSGAISWKGLPARWLWVLTGLVSILFGILLFWRPVVGAAALVWAVGIYAMVFGVMSFVHGIEVFGLRRMGPHEPVGA
jgi:uncharacterized membrane protein HdeD (DUF308 family)